MKKSLEERTFEAILRKKLSGCSFGWKLSDYVWVNKTKWRVARYKREFLWWETKDPLTSKMHSGKFREMVDFMASYA